MTGQILQVIGVVLLVAAATIIWPPAGLIVAGLALLVFGTLNEIGE